MPVTSQIPPSSPTPPAAPHPAAAPPPNWASLHPVSGNIPAQFPVGRARRMVGVLVVTMAVVLAAAACAPDNSSSSTARPRTAASLQIVSPTPNQVTGPAIDLKLALSGATVVSPSEVSGVNPTEGHIHVSVDGKLVSMTYGLSQHLGGLTPGSHTVQAEFVASDHRAFANRVVAAVVFQVQ
jgi:hypothetical protein